ncbi:MAG: glycosyltransferase family 2 protein [Planctomycetes bacterium]|jgi:glycosyltransferase involved in cell wall biosynthesis|nr:glycosyltransferase family 2 protein [Planctomycetota bacterium]
MRLYVLIPAYNEAETIAAVIAAVPRQIDKISAVKILVINDGSTDETARRAQAAGADLMINNCRNIGLARTFKKGLDAALAAGADIIVNTDADGQYDQREIPALIKPLLENRAEIVIGDRQVTSLKFMPAGNKYGNLLGSWILRKISGTNVRDASSGFRALSRQAALRINIFNRHTYTHEMIIQAAYHNMAVAEVPITFRPRLKGKSRLIKGLSSHIRDSGMIILRTILYYRPLRTLAGLSSLLILPGMALGLRFVYHYFNREGGGMVQSLILASILVIIGFNVLILGLIGDLIAKNRQLNEEALYQIKKNK